MNLIERSKEVLLDSCLANGAIIAANSDRPDYPHEVQSYRYVWPRDASFICEALEALGMVEQQLAFYRWLSRAEDLKQTGLIFQNYYTNGRKRWLAFQPDQNGIVMWSLARFIERRKEHTDEFMPLLRMLADGICRVWDREHFSAVTQDLWEEFFTYPEMKTTHTYSLAACIAGLESANRIGENGRWKNVAAEMRRKIESSQKNGIFLRRSGLVQDERPDISLLGLVWPFGIYDTKHPAIKKTVKRLHEALEHNSGFYRYQYDDYDGFRFQGDNARRGAGTWPIATFWMAKYYQLAGDKKKAEFYIASVMKRIDKNGNIPEQLFDNDIQVSIKPLAWSHAMHVLTS
jgi:GH15 family glucan-1,4-alpha-glucosidase